VAPLECWRRLKPWCEKWKGADYVTDVPLNKAELLVEAAARDDGHADEVLALLAEEVDEWRDNPMRWLEGLAAGLAGEMRLEAAVRPLAAKLHDDTGWTREQVVRALVRIGTDEVVDAVTEGFAGAEWDCRLYTCGVLEGLDSDVAVARSLALCENEDDSDIEIGLLGAALGNFETDAVAPARDWVLRGDRELRRPLIAVAILTGTELPGSRKWLADIASKEKAAEERLASLANLFKRAQTHGGSHNSAPTRDLPPPPSAAVTAPATTERKIGRNAPCPCGSGRKYKKCCMNSGT